MNVSLRAIRYLVATAELGNLTEAAKKLNVSQPSISAAIAQVEQQFGVQVFVRHHAKGVTLTPSGRRIVNEGRLLLKHAQDFSQNAIAMGDELRGEIVVGCFVNLAIRYMPSLLARFAQTNPAIQVRLEEGDHQEIVESLRSGLTEVAVAYEYALPDEMVAQSLVALPPHVILAADHPLATRAAINLGELADEPFIMLDLPYSRDYFLSLFRASGTTPKISAKYRSYELIRGLVSQRRGFTIHNAISRTSVTYDGTKLAAVPLSGDLAPLRVMSVRLRNHSMRPAARAFQDCMLEAFRPGGILSNP